ncbi:MAG TPA: hypothetical protein DCG54_01505, partial [Anaerolineae bacterium]|nr:hypothetical protein [Anaerolineae bacterium]
HAGFLLGDLAAQQFLQSKQGALRLFLCRKTPCMFQHRLIIAIVSLVPMDGRFFQSSGREHPSEQVAMFFTLNDCSKAFTVLILL